MCTPVITALGKLRQEDLEFRPTLAMGQDPTQRVRIICLDVCRALASNPRKTNNSYPAIVCMYPTPLVKLEKLSKNQELLTQEQKNMSFPLDTDMLRTSLIKLRSEWLWH